MAASRLGAVAFAVLGGAALFACSGAAGAKQAPAVAPSGPPVVTATALAAAERPGPPSARQQESIDVSCPPGTTLLAGGAKADLLNGKSPNPSLRLVGSVPSGTPLGATWKAIVATGGVDQAGSRVSSLALCGRGASAPGLTVVVANSAGPTAAASNARATATCPAGTVLVGGGAWVSLANGQAGPPQYFITASFPSTAAGRPAVTGPSPTSWSAIGALGGAPMTGGRVQAVAECLAGAPTSVTVVVASTLGPTAAQRAQVVTATCPKPSLLVGGGVYTGPAKLDHTLQGLHLRGSFPSDSSGGPVVAGARPTSWSVIANSGGVIAVGAHTTAYALCSAPPPPAA